MQTLPNFRFSMKKLSDASERILLKSLEIKLTGVRASVLKMQGFILEGPLTVLRFSFLTIMGSTLLKIFTFALMENMSHLLLIELKLLLLIDFNYFQAASELESTMTALLHLIYYYETNTNKSS